MVKNLLSVQETQVRSLGQKEPLEKKMAVYPRILAWRIPWIAGQQDLGGIFTLLAPPGLSGAFMETCDSAKMAGVSGQDRPRGLVAACESGHKAPMSSPRELVWTPRPHLDKCPRDLHFSPADFMEVGV